MTGAGRGRRRHRAGCAGAARRLATIAGLTAALAAAGGPGAREVPFAAGAYTFAADTAGTIHASIYSLPSDVVAAADAAALLDAVARQAPGRALLALVDPPMREALVNAVGPAVRLIAMGERVYSPWPRDPFSLARRSDGGVLALVRPNVQPGREADATMAQALLAGLPAEVDRAWGGAVWSRAPVAFHNGQMLVDEERVWLSLHSQEPRILEILGLSRVPVESLGTAAGAARYLAAARRAAAELGAMTGREPAFVHPLAAGAEGLERLPELAGGAGFDLDSLVTLLPAAGGDARALVGDVTLGAELAARLAAEDLAALAGTYRLAPAGAELSAALVAAQQAARARGLDAFADLVAAHLAAGGMEVARLPLLVVPTSLVADGFTYDHQDFLLTWSNVVLDWRDGATRAEGFAAGLPAADLAARRTFAVAGVELTLLPPLVGSVVRGGGYRCASNHLR